MHYRDSRQMVTGLVVNEKVNVRSEYYRNARAMCDSLFLSGQYFRSVTPPSEPGEEPVPDLTENLSPLEGILSHIYAVTQSAECRSLQDQRKKPRAIRKLYRRFLFYKYCIALEAPLIITEGKTDPIYIREAIRYRKAYQPQLGESGEVGFEFAIRFFNYNGQAHEVMDLGGGTGDLKSIPLDYLRNLGTAWKGIRPFQHKPMAHPVILLLDNDGGLGAVASTVKKHFDVTVKTISTSDFYHITDNLYLIKTPEQTGESCIEDLFPDEVKNAQLKEKKFSSKGTISPDTEFGKEVFAKSVVKPNAHKIDFSAFDELLDRIVAALEDYSARARSVKVLQEREAKAAEAGAAAE